MSRREITAELSDALESQVLSKLPFWAAEVEFGRYDIWHENDYRPDYVAFEPKGGSRSIASVEAGTLHVFEVKSCYADLTSGHGMNRIGDVNWLVMPAELYRSMVENDKPVPSGWNVVVHGWTEPGAMLWHNDSSVTRTGRQVPLSQALWCMLASPRNTFTAHARGGMALGNYLRGGEEGPICPVPSANVTFDPSKITFDDEGQRLLYEKFRKLAGLEQGE